jgi:recombination protein RecR
VKSAMIQREKILFLCVVEKPVDVIAVEKSGGFFGRYHVLHALWSPMRGIRPQDTGIVELVARIKTSHEGSDAKPINELILATGSTVEGDATGVVYRQ